MLAVACDVSKPESLVGLADAAYGKFGDVSFLMNNAGVGTNPGKPWENLDAWKALIDVNFWGVVHGVQAFGKRMLAQAAPAIIVNTGSKQGITTPPGNLAYNVSKSALKTYTEGLAHALRNTPGAQVTAHLLIPGFTYTGITEGATSKPAGAWTGEQVADFMLESLARGDFYILCPDNDTPRATRRAPHGLGGRRHHREPPGPVALASGLRGRLCAIHRQLGPDLTPAPSPGIVVRTLRRLVAGRRKMLKRPLVSKNATSISPMSRTPSCRSSVNSSRSVNEPDPSFSSRILPASMTHSGPPSILSSSVLFRCRTKPVARCSRITTVITRNALQQPDLGIEHRVAGRRADGDHEDEFERPDLPDGALPDHPRKKDRVEIHDQRAQHDLEIEGTLAVSASPSRMRNRSK